MLDSASAPAALTTPAAGSPSLPPILPALRNIVSHGIVRHHHKLRPVALLLRTTSLPYANLSQSQSVNTARKIRFEVVRQGL